jgi:2-amino-4-hydroxy-6-hydroxymethyldihydropteridine diphosphokinase
MQVFLGLGSNLGDREAYLKKAISALDDLNDCEVRQVSSVYETEPWGKKDLTEFLNQVVELETRLGAQELLTACKRIEEMLGRRNGKSGESRTMDIDLLLYGDRVIEENFLHVPHPRLPARRFALVPLDEIASNVIIPGSGKTVREALELCSDTLGVSVYQETVEDG